MLIQNRAEAAVQRLRTEITSGVLGPGTLLAEASVARQLEMSRVPVREALFALEREGLVEFSSTGRAYVKELTPADFEELLMLRLMLEPAAARIAVPFVRAKPAEVEANIAATELAASLHDVTHLDLDFHQLILEASGQKRLTRLWKSLRSELELWLARLHVKHQERTNETREATLRSHRSILNCIMTQPPAGTERMIRNHIQGWRDVLPKSAGSSEHTIELDVKKPVPLIATEPVQSVSEISAQDAG